MTAVVLFILIMAGLGAYQWQKSRQQASQLQQSGFTLSQDLGGNPQLLLDNRQHELALVWPDRYQRIALADIRAAEVAFDRGVQINTRFRIELVTGAGLEKVFYENETLARVALDKLRPHLD